MITEITEAKLKFWIDNNFNVLFSGRTGVGKTARVIEAFTKAKLKWLYFSAATLDPWVDVIGVPKEVKDIDGNSYLDLIRPKPFAKDEVEAVFFDELNRSSRKIRNAVMELIQFKSINGKKFNNLRIIWAAINPEDKITNTDEFEYDIERLDPAQKDRFHIHIDVPYEVDKTYFSNKFGDEIAQNAIDWWNQSKDEDKNLVSPRRLDYALEVYIKGGDLRDVLPNQVNITKLSIELKNGSYIKQVTEIFDKKDIEKAKSFIKIKNNYDNTINYILKKDNMIDFFLPYVNEEDLINLMINEIKIYNYVVKSYEKYKDTIYNIMNVNNMPKLVKKLKKEPKILEMSRNLKSDVMSNQFKQLSFSSSLLDCKPTTSNKYSLVNGSLSGQSLSNYINQPSLINNIKKGVEYRVVIFHKILANITTNDTITDFVTSLNIISKIIEYSSESTLKESFYEGLSELFGFLVKQLSIKSNNNIQDIVKKIENSAGSRLKQFLFDNSKLYA